MKENEMIHVYCPDNNQEEREYVLITLFQEFLDIGIQISFEERNDYKFLVQDKIIIISDDFFNRYQEPLGYLKEENIPRDIAYQKILDIEIPLIWGNEEYSFTSKEWYIGNDLFAGAFFFLSQWEEYILKQVQGLEIRDKLDENILFVTRNGLQKKCLVNDILEFLKVILTRCGVMCFREHHFDVMLTHDVDRCYLSGYEELCESIYGMLQSGAYERAKRILGDYISYRQQDANPFNSFDELMDISAPYEFKNYFYFKPCVEGDEGFTYSISDEFVVETIKNINARNHYIGLHATENTPNSLKALKVEYERLSEVDIEGGRTHNLIYTPDVFDNLNTLGLSYDSGVGFQYCNGFRSSVCYPYSIFHVPGRKKLKIKQYPFMVMDSVSIRNKMNAEDFFEDAISVIDVVKKYGGVFVTNWHSNMFNIKGREEFKEVYSMIIEYLFKIMK